MTNGFASFVQIPNAVLHWYSEQELLSRIEANDPSGTWFRLALLEAILFEPYYPLAIEIDKKGNATPSKKYSLLLTTRRFSKAKAEHYLDELFPETYCDTGYIKRLRECHDKVIRDLAKALKAPNSLTIMAPVALMTLVTGSFNPSIAVALVGSNFAGLSGAALKSACLAYLGGGSIAAGGMGMAGGAVAIIGGGVILGLGVGVAVNKLTGTASVPSIQQSAKLIVAVREIFLNDEHDLAFADRVCDQYVQKIQEIEKSLVKLRLQYDDLTEGKDKKPLNDQIKEAEATVKIMRTARKILRRFISSFKIGLEQNQK